MAQLHGLYKLDYVAAQGIIITNLDGTQQVFPVITPPQPLPPAPPVYESPFTPFHYSPAVPPAPYLQIAGTTLPNFTYTQLLIRMWDMMKDGSAVMRNQIWPLMSQGNPLVSYERFADMRRELVGLAHISAKITRSGWIKPNTYETEHGKLTSRCAYQESGISPNSIITNPNYVVNIANTVIDPFTRDFSSAQTDKTYFPGALNRVQITAAFFNFMGFSHCELDDRQLTNGITEDAHNYRLKVSPLTTITKHNVPPPPYAQSHPKGWYAGNPLKNDNFPLASADEQHALLNVKECGDLTQVFLMFIAVYTILRGMIHTMVTGDSVVFMICIMLGLDCVYYQHLPRVAPNAHGENYVYHFNARYTLDNAKEYFRNIKATIRDHNTTLINRIRSINNPGIPRISIHTLSHELVDNFHFCPRFLDDIIADMEEIHAKLMELDPNQLLLNGDTDQASIIRLNNFTFQLKLYYKLKVLFTSRSRRNEVNFSGIYSKYTEKPTPQNLVNVNIVQPVINLDQGDNANQDDDVDDEADEVHAPNQPQQQGAIFIPAPGWRLQGYDRGTPFYTLYVNRYVSAGDCMHPTERRANPAIRNARAAAAAAGVPATPQERHAQQQLVAQLIREQRREAVVTAAAVRAQKRESTAISGGVISPSRKTSPKRSPSSSKTSPKKSPSSHKTSHKKSSSTRKTSRSNSPSKWDIFDLDLDQTVLYTEKTSACKDPNKPSQCKTSPMPDGDYFPTVNIHKEWIGDILLFISKFCRKTNGAREIFDMYKQEFFREMYEHCDNYNVVLTGKALDNLTRKTIKGIIRIHHTYLKPIIANKASMQKSITHTTPLTTEQLTMIRNYLAQQKQNQQRVNLPQNHRLAITAGGRHTQKRSKNTLHRTRKLLRAKH